MWKIYKLSELCSSLHQGLNTAGEKIIFSDSGYPIIQTRNVKDDSIDITEKIKFINNNDWKKYKDKYKPMVGDVFFTNIGTIGRTAIVKKDIDYLIHWNIFKIRPIKSLCLPEFLKYQLDCLTKQGYFMKIQTGGTVSFVTKKMISDASIPVPPLPEQKRIVAKLDKAFAEIDKAIEANANKEAKIKNLKSKIIIKEFENIKEYTQSKLGDYYDVRDGTHESPKYHEDGFPLVTSKNLKNGKIDLSNIKYICKNDYDAINKRSEVNVGDILMAMIGTIGNAVVVVEEPLYSIKNVALFKLNSKQNSKFLLHFLNSPNTIKKMADDAKGTTQKFVGLNYLRDFPIKIPSIELQNNLTKKLDSILKELQDVESKINKSKLNYQALKSAILKKELQSEAA